MTTPIVMPNVKLSRRRSLRPTIYQMKTRVALSGEDGSGNGHPFCETQPGTAIARLVSASHEYHQLVRAETALVNQVKAFGRRHKNASDVERLLATKTLLNARSVIRPQRLAVAREIEREAGRLPAYSWTKRVPGIGALSLGLITAEASELNGYANPAKLWKRFGLHVEDGAAPSLYSRRRRALMHVVGENLVRRNGPTGEFYRLYVDRKKYESEQHPDFSPIRCHKRALRYMEKRFLKDLWLAWRRTSLPSSDNQVSIAAGATSPEPGEGGGA